MAITRRQIRESIANADDRSTIELVMRMTGSFGPTTMQETIFIRFAKPSLTTEFVFFIAHDVGILVLF
jgi:hypothetical protein